MSQESSPITQWQQAINGILLGIAVDEVRNEATTESRGKAQEAITSATIELIEGLIGEDEDYKHTAEYREEGRNDLRAQLRQSLKEMK